MLTELARLLRKHRGAFSMRHDPDNRVTVVVINGCCKGKRWTFQLHVSDVELMSVMDGVEIIEPDIREAMWQVSEEMFSESSE